MKTTYVKHINQIYVKKLNGPSAVLEIHVCVQTYKRQLQQNMCANERNINNFTSQPSTTPIR